jgi:hypothetical protein
VSLALSQGIEQIPKEKAIGVVGQNHGDGLAVGDEQVKGDALYWSAFNLDLNNPRAATKPEHLPPEQLIESIIEKERRILDIMEEIKRLLGRGSRTSRAPHVSSAGEQLPKG